MDAALGLLREGGLAAVTTNALAASARCSKVTLYNLFSDREAVIAALIRRQAAALNQILEIVSIPEGPARVRERLVEAGAHLYRLLLSETSLAINRAALADGSGELSRLLIEQGQAKSAPMIRALLAETFDLDPHDASGKLDGLYRSFYGVLMSDRQILALHRAIDPDPPFEACKRAAQEAVRILDASA